MDVHPPKNGINRYWSIPILWKINNVPNHQPVIDVNCWFQSILITCRSCPDDLVLFGFTLQSALGPTALSQAQWPNGSQWPNHAIAFSKSGWWFEPLWKIMEFVSWNVLTFPQKMESQKIPWFQSPPTRNLWTGSASLFLLPNKNIPTKFNP